MRRHKKKIICLAIILFLVLASCLAVHIWEHLCLCNKLPIHLFLTRDYWIGNEALRQYDCGMDLSFLVGEKNLIKVEQRKCSHNQSIMFYISENETMAWPSAKKIWWQ